MRATPNTGAACGGVAALAAVGAVAYLAPLVTAAPAGRRLAGRLVLTRVDTAGSEVALTFDDGPDPRWTERIAAALGTAKATFFVLDEQAERFPDVVRSLRQAGHTVGLHGHRHVSLLGLSPGAAVDDLRRGRDARPSPSRTTPGSPPAAPPRAGRAPPPWCWP